MATSFLAVPGPALDLFGRALDRLAEESVTMKLPLHTTIFCSAALTGTLLLASCGGSTAATTTPTTGLTPNAYTAVYKAMTWGAGVTVTFPSACSMTIVSTGVPTYHDAYYLGPVSTQYPVQVAVTNSGLKLAVQPYAPANITPSSGAFNICPAKAAATTATNLGAIGYISSGELLYNAFEATLTAALGDNVSYTFTSGGVSYMASFIDKCNSHATPLTASYTWHFHGVPTCVAAATDGASGPSHLLGIALDGFPVYGGRDTGGNIIPVAQLDACNGITSATPEFPSAAYHYVLPIGVTNQQSSMNCYAGTVSSTVMAQMEKLACKMKNMQTDAMLQAPAAVVPTTGTATAPAFAAGDESVAQRDRN